MIYIQTTIEINEEKMNKMAIDSLVDIESTLEDYGYPTTKEIKIALVKEILKKLS